MTFQHLCAFEELNLGGWVSFNMPDVYTCNSDTTQLKDYMFRETKSRKVICHILTSIFLNVFNSHFALPVQLI